MFGKLSLQQAPPLSVPARFFLTAPVFGMIAALILLFGGKDVLVSRWTPELLAITHCLTLGVVTSVMMGAIQQMLPVLIGSVIDRPRRFAAWIHGLWTPGVALLVASFLSFRPVLFIPAFLLIAAAVFMFVAVILHSLLRGVSANPSAPGMKLAVVSLLIASLLGIALALGYAEVIPLWRPALTNLHLSWGLIGWVGVLIMAVAWQVVPMFQITRSYPPPLLRLTVPAITALLILKSIPAGSAGDAIATAADIGIALVLSGFAVATLYLQRISRRKIRDSHKDFWRLGMFNLLLALAFWITAGATGNPQFDLLTGVFFLAGFVMAVLTGMLLKIIAFLIWLHLQALHEALQAGDKPGFIVPKMKRVIPDRKSDALLFTLTLAQLSIIGAILFPARLTAPAALVWLVFFGLLGYVLGRAVWRYHRIVREFT